MTSTQTCTFNTTISKYTTVNNDGEFVEISKQTVLEQISWLSNIVKTQADALIVQHFNAEDLTELYTRTNPTEDMLSDTITAGLDNYQLPSSAHVTAERLGWKLTVDAAFEKYGVYLPDRMIRMVTQEVVQTLRSTARRYLITQAALDYKQQNPDNLPLTHFLNELEQIYGIETSYHEVQNRLNAVANKLRNLPSFEYLTFFDLEDPPTLSSRLLAAATDKQFQRFMSSYKDNSVDPNIIWELKLPTTATPQDSNDYQRVQLHYHLPKYTKNVVKLNTPTIRLTKDKQHNTQLILDCSYVQTIPVLPSLVKRRQGPVVAIDWNVRNLVTLITGHLSKSRNFVLDSRPLFFTCQDLLIKRANLQDENNYLQAKTLSRTKYHDMLADNPSTDLAYLEKLSSQVLTLGENRESVNNKRKNLTKQIAYAVAHWILDQTLVTGANRIYCEDLKSLNAGPKTGYNPARRSITTAFRGKVFKYLQVLASRHGIELVQISAINTSKTCSKCDSLDTTSYTHSVTKKTNPHKHYNKPVQRPGGKWFYCNCCGYCVDRDYNAAVNIARFGIKYSERRVVKSRKQKKTVSVAGIKVKHNFKKRYATAKRPGKRTRKPLLPANSSNTHNNNTNSNNSDSFQSFNSRSTASTFLRTRRLRGGHCEHTRLGIRTVSQTGSYGLYPYVNVNQLILKQ